MPPSALPDFACVQSPIDYGFENHTEFDRGVMDCRPGVEGDVDLTAFQTPLSTGSRICSSFAAAASGECQQLCQLFVSFTVPHRLPYQGVLTNLH